jgi:hypothetical protein
LDPDSGKGVKLFEGSDGYLFVKRDFHFYKDDALRGKVIGVRKRVGYEPEMTQATIDFSALVTDLVPASGNTYAHLDIFLGVHGADPYIYSRPWKDKGIPFWIDFTVTSKDTGATIAQKVANVIKKDHLFLVDKDLISVSVDGAKLTLTGENEFQRIKKVTLSVAELTQEYPDLVSELGETGITLDKQGKNGFGTYSQIIKDLRLPTAMNSQWLHLRQVETPIVGAIYDQYIIDYCAPSVNDGLQAVGQRMETFTQHVFWVRHDDTLISEWESALGKVGTITDVDAETKQEDVADENGLIAPVSED